MKEEYLTKQSSLGIPTFETLPEVAEQNATSSRGVPE